jgi:hypothetical protein
VRENRTHGSEGGDGESRFRPLSNAAFSFSVGERKIMNHLVETSGHVPTSRHFVSSRPFTSVTAQSVTTVVLGICN